MEVASSGSGKAKEGICPPEATRDTARPHSDIQLQPIVSNIKHQSAGAAQPSINNCTVFVRSGKANEGICPPEDLRDTARPYSALHLQQTIPHNTQALTAEDWSSAPCQTENCTSAASVLSGKSKEGICPPEATRDTARPYRDLHFQPSDGYNTDNFVVAAQHLSDAPTSPVNDMLVGNTESNRPPSSIQSIQKQLSLYYQNVRGLRTIIDELFVAVSDAEYDVIILTETWLNDEINSLQLFGTMYTVYRRDRDPASCGKTRGGGVLIAVSNKFSSKQKTCAILDIEQLWVSIRYCDTDICVGGVYLPPDSSSDVSVIQKHIDSVLAVANSLDPHAIHLIFGDYNQPGLVWKSTLSDHAVPDPSESAFPGSSVTLLDGMCLLNMLQMSTVKNSRDRTLDLLFVNAEATSNCKIVEAYEPLVEADPYHPPLFACLLCPQLVVFDEVSDVREFNFSKTDLPGLERSLLSFDWNDLLSQSADVNTAVDTFTTVLLQQFRTHVPPPRQRPKPPWSNGHLRVLKRLRATALRNYTNRRNPLTKREFVCASNEYKTYNRFLYSRHVLRTQFDLKRNPKRFWHFVNGKRKENGLPCNMVLGNESSNTLSGTCNLFAKHFASVFSTDSASSAQIENAIRNVPNDILNLSDIRFTDQDILVAIKKLKSSTTPGPDGIPSIIFKKCAYALCGPLKQIFNLSLSQSIFPSRWKKSTMFPVFKKGYKQDITNYRGITSLCVGSKLFEILVGGILLREAKAYISTNQHGFFPGRSTTTNLAQFTSHCIRNMETGVQTDAIYTDLKAAFDRVDHSILLAKIERLGASPNVVNWLSSYLVDRILCVKIGDEESRSFTNASGVPQGSNLGPLLFSLFFNDVCYVLPPGCYLIYADDLKLFLVVRSVEDCIVLQRYLDDFSNWCARNLLIISVPKCSVISFSRRKNPILWDYTISTTSLNRITVVKDLGVLLDTQLTFRNHYSYIIARANRNLGFIMRIARKFTDPYCLRALYFSLVRSILEGSASIWSPYTDIWSNRIEAIQARFLRFALRSLPWRNPMDLPPYVERCRLLDMNTLAGRRDMARAVFVGKLLTGEIDSPLLLAQININAPPRNLRSRDFLRLQHQRTEYGQNEPVRAMCDVFNRFYMYFDFSVSCDVFKNRLKLLTL